LQDEVLLSKIITEDSSVLSEKESILNKRIDNDFNFPIDNEDILFTLTFNPSIYKENVSSLISKMVIIRELSYINLDTLSKILAAMRIKELNIFSIDNQINRMKIVKRNNGCFITYTEMGIKHFTTLLNCKKEKADFFDYNKYSLYILRNGGFLDIKKLFNNINGYEVNIGRGGSQKAHILSPLDLRLGSYLLAMFNFDYNLVSYLNAFNDLGKDRYLTYMDKTNKS
jgi:hypothetical protein